MKRKKRKTERRRPSSQRPEQPTIVSTSYTTSWDLTANLTERGEPGTTRTRLSQRSRARFVVIAPRRLQAQGRRQPVA